MLGEILFGLVLIISHVSVAIYAYWGGKRIGQMEAEASRRYLPK